MMLENFKKKLNSVEGKTLLRSFTSLSILQIAGYVFPLISLPYLTTTIGVEKFGELAFASAIIIYFQTFIDYGFNFTGTREIARNRDDLSEISKIYSNIFWARCLLMIVAFCLLLILIYFVPFFRNIKLLLLLTFSLIPGRILFSEWFFQGMEEMKFITILNIIAKAIFTGSIFVFIQSKEDYLYQPLLNALGFLASGIIAQYIIYCKMNITLKKPSLYSIYNSLNDSTDVFINQLFPNLYTSVSNLLLGFFAGNYALGIFNAGSKFIGIAYQFIFVITRTFFPFLSRNIKGHSLYRNITLGFTFSAILFLMSFAPLIIELFYGDEFIDSTIVLRILAISLLFMACSNIYGTNYLVIENQEKVLRNITIISSVFGFIIAWPLIFYYSFRGAALTLLLSRGFYGILLVQRSLKISSKKLKYS